MRYYLVTGRICGDDEDTSLLFPAESRDDAIAVYKDLMWGKDGTPPAGAANP